MGSRRIPLKVNIIFSFCFLFNPIDDLYNYFNTFGQVNQAKIIYNKKTQNSKGYGFVTLPSIQMFERLQNITHKLHGRCLDINIGCKKTDAPKEIKDRAKKTIFVNGLPEGLSDCNFIPF